MEKEHKEAEKVDEIGSLDETEDTTEAAELVLYQVSECYVYLVFQSWSISNSLSFI